MNTRKYELSDRERRIVAVLCTTGAPDKQIAMELGIAPGTVKVHLKAIYFKLNVRNRTQIVIKMLRAQWERENAPEPEFS